MKLNNSKHTENVDHMQPQNVSISKKINVGILFGGKSAEHDVSIQSAKNVLLALDTAKYEPVVIGIDRNGAWYHIPPARLQYIASSPAVPLRDIGSRVSFMLGDTPHGIFDMATKERVATVDVVFPVTHGPYGEDGTLQGVLEQLDMPYVGPGVLGSAIGMDKDIMKRLLRDAGLPIAPFMVSRSLDEVADMAVIFQTLGSTVFVKPANMGSSIGVNKATSDTELRQALAQAFRYDTKVLIESAIDGVEVECAVLGNTQPRASVLGQISPENDGFYSYDAKYIDESGAALKIPADISQETAALVQHIALQTYAVLECEGMARVDMFVDANDTVIINEVNTLPGFTEISMYPKLWQASGLSYRGLVSELIDLAFDRYARRQAIVASVAT